MKFFNALSRLESPDQATLAAVVEELSTAFESYLKKIALLRYEGDITRLYGNADYVGLIGSTLGPLIDGKVAKNRGPVRRGSFRTNSNVARPLTNVRDNVYDACRSERNNVHITLNRPMTVLWEQIRIIFAAFLFATEENAQLIREKLDPIARYLARIKEQLAIWEREILLM